MNQVNQWMTVPTQEAYANNVYQFPIDPAKKSNPHVVDLGNGIKVGKELREGAPIAPWPLIDRYPTIIGSGLSLAYLSTCYRLALTGHRREYVDALTELLERDPHLYAVLMQRVMTACGARIVLLPRDQKSPRCIKIAAEVQKIVDGIYGLRQALATICFSGIYYGLGACEIDWEPTTTPLRRGQTVGWIPKKLRFIHSRRLNYPDPGSWDLRIWDMGQVGALDKAYKTIQTYGLKVEDYPGKFVVFAPQLHADYPTREGVGRIVGFWSALKVMGARGAAQYVERYAKPWAIATYSTTNTGIPRAAEASAQNNDVGAATAALAALGTGSLAGAAVPDSVKLTLQQIVGSRSAIGHKDWIDICNREMSKGVLGQTDTTDGGSSGSRARASVMKQGSNQIARLDVMLLADCMQIGLIDTIVRLNYSKADYEKRPILSLAVDPEPDPFGVVKLASEFAASGAPVDADEIARTIGIRLVDKKDKKARKLVPVKPMEAVLLNPDLFDQPETEEGMPSDGNSSDASPSDEPSEGSGTEDDDRDEEDEEVDEDDEEDDEE